jgi:hypothetical protein
MTVALAQPIVECGGGLEWVAALIDLPELHRRGWNPATCRFVPAAADPNSGSAAADPLFGYARCPVRGCVSVTEHSPTALCYRCQHRYGRWTRANDGGLDGFLAAVTQSRSEDPERICLVCCTPGS